MRDISYRSKGITDISGPQTTMTELEFRPRFRFHSPLPAHELKLRLRHAVETRNMHEIRLGGTADHHVLSFAPHLQRAWTPQMDVDLEPVEGGTQVRCLIGPSPSIWMLFTGGYMLCAALALLGLSIGVGQQVVGADAWGFLLVAPTPFIAVMLWTIAQVGKHRARPRMRILKRFVDEAFGCDCFAMADRL